MTARWQLPRPVPVFGVQVSWTFMYEIGVLLACLAWIVLAITMPSRYGYEQHRPARIVVVTSQSGRGPAHRSG